MQAIGQFAKFNALHVEFPFLSRICRASAAADGLNRFAIRARGRYSSGMPRSLKKKPTAAKLRSWRISILRQRAHNLGIIEAPDAKTAEAEAVKLFRLTDEQRKRLAVQERES